MPITPLTGGSITGMKSLYAAGAGTTEEEPGFLLSLALALDAPRNWAWGGTSKKRVTGWDALRKMGIRDKPGFDPVDILAFGLEVVGDPLTYLGGLGGLTKAGKLASSLGKATGSRAASTAAIKTAMEGAEKFNVKQLLKATKEVEKGGDLAKITKGLELTSGEATRFERGVTAVKRAHEAQTRTRTLKSQLNEMGASEILAKTWKAAGQGDLPQRKLLSLTIPFTDVEKVLIRGAPVLGAIQASGQLLGKFPPIAATGRLISNAFQRSEVLQPYMNEYRLQVRQIMREGGEKGDALAQKGDELFELERASQVQATERYARKKYKKSAAELTEEEIQKRFDETFQRSYATADDYTRESFDEDILNGREAYGMEPVIRDEIRAYRASLVEAVEVPRGKARGSWEKEIFSREVAQRTSNEKRAVRLEAQASSLEKLKTPLISRIEGDLKRLQGKFDERLKWLAVASEEDIKREADVLLDLRKQIDEAEYKLARAGVDKDTFQSALGEVAPGHKVLTTKGGKFGGFDRAEELAEIAEKRNIDVADLLEERRSNFVDLQNATLRTEKLQKTLGGLEGDIEAQIGKIEKKMGKDGKWATAQGKGRAGEAGTLTRTVYHGTNDPSLKLTDLDPGKAVETEGAVFFTSSEDMASQFTLPREYGEIITERGTGTLDEYGQEIFEEISAGPILKGKLEIKNPLIVGGKEAQDIIDDTILQGKLVRRAKKEGHDGIILRDVAEFGDPISKGDVYAVFDKKQIHAPTAQPRPSRFGAAKTKYEQNALKGRFRLTEAEIAKALKVKGLRSEVDNIRQELIHEDKILKQVAQAEAEAAIPKISEINPDLLLTNISYGPGYARGGMPESVLAGGLGTAPAALTQGRKLPNAIKGPLMRAISKLKGEKDNMIRALYDNLDENEAYVSLLRPESQALVKNLDQEVGELLARRVAVGATKEGTVLAARLQSITKNYAERVLTTDARKYISTRRATDGKGGTMLDQYHRYMGRYSKSQMSAKTGGDSPRLDRWRETFTSQVNKFFEKLPGDRPAQWFNKDFSVTYPGKYIGDERSVLNATFVKSLVNGKGIVKKILKKNAHDYVTLGDFYMEHGIHRVTAKIDGELQEIVLGDSKAARKAMKDAGLLNKGIRNSLADEIRGVTVKLVDSDDMSHLGEIYDKMILGPLRWSLTRPWLPFHLRNFSTNIFLNWLGGVSNPKFYKMGFRAVFKDQDELKRLTDIGVLTGGWSREAAKELTDAGRINVWSKMEKWFKKKYPKGSERWKKYTSFAEDMGRAAHYYGKKADGLTDFEALESVNKYLLDYSDLTKFERRYGKRMFMFYNWTRKMIPMLTKEFISNPSKMAALTRGSVQPSLLRPEGLPEYIKASFALPLPWKDRKGREQFVTTFGSPIEEFRKFDVSQREGGLAGIGSELARTIIGQMTPPFKQAAEIAAGKDFFYRKPIQEADRVKQMFGLEKLLPGLRTDVLKSGKTRLRADPDMLYALRQSPFSRVISTLQKLGDPDRDLSDKLFATLSGINVARFYKETQAPRNMVDMLKRKLKLKIPEGMVRNFETIYATEAGKKNAEVMRLMEILRGAEKKSRAVYQTSGGKL